MSESQNPLEALGGGFDMNALLQQAQAMQSRLEQAQAELAEASVDGTAGSGAVTVTVSGTGELTGVTVKPGSFDGGDADDLETLGDLVVAAYRDAKAQADQLAGQTLGPLAGGLPGLPGDAPGGAGGTGGAGPLGF